QGLRNVGGSARAAAPMLVPLLGDGDGRVRTAARDALSHIDPAAQAARDGFLLKDLPGFVLGGSSYKADPYIEAAVKLQAVGEEKAGWLLSELAEDPEHGDKVIVLCRMLFTAGPKAEFRRPGLRGPTFLGSTGY